ncbi:16S rRNA (guanine(966)-N(2))-methyltransferase RsmD [Mumia zhuanghuii]|uniref:16S rRNA (Guanine(966)-N(2))-methyltransferase RsmD n=2 Tax=Mumia TaxID=1546255 RepID=A0ABW1QM39_9ACTN|nr:MULTISPECIES: 16S rRNA (guanine(966)-N(2))-methyltransferase RsmD [Mumia]KAA1423615.1 16S rRNA (guanine(966)-N(2))-methyltransferase RsmD [Mumia zhuanghuii]
MTRIIAGRLGGRRLATPPGSGTRPTSDRVREALFSALESRMGGLADARVLDLYAGSGALGLEAISRGAAHATLVEADRRTAVLIRRNAHELGVADAVTVAAVKVRTFTARPPATPYDVIIADPPYDLSDADLAVVLQAVATPVWLDPDGILVVERSTRGPALSWPATIDGESHRAYGETALWYGRPHD